MWATNDTGRPQVVFEGDLMAEAKKLGRETVVQAC